MFSRSVSYTPRSPVEVIRFVPGGRRLTVLAYYRGGRQYTIRWDVSQVPHDLVETLQRDARLVMTGDLRPVIHAFPDDPGSYELELSYCAGPDPVLCGYFGRRAYRAARPSKPLERAT